MVEWKPTDMVEEYYIIEHDKRGTSGKYPVVLILKQNAVDTGKKLR
jgi:hypothetical protein